MESDDSSPSSYLEMSVAIYEQNIVSTRECLGLRR
jgi:hypothetical protein